MKHYKVFGFNGRFAIVTAKSEGQAIRKAKFWGLRPGKYGYIVIRV